MRRHNNKVNGYQTRSPHDQILLTRRTGCTSLQLFTHHRSTCHITFEAHWPGRGHGTGHGVDGLKMSEWDDDRTAQMNHCVTSGQRRNSNIISVRLWSNHFQRPLWDAPNLVNSHAHWMTVRGGIGACLNTVLLLLARVNGLHERGDKCPHFKCNYIRRWVI